MIKFKKNQEIVYDSTFTHVEKGVKIRFVVTKSTIIEKRNFQGIKTNEFYKGVLVSKDIYNLYRVDTNGASSRKINLLTSTILELCINAIKFILEKNK